MNALNVENPVILFLKERIKGGIKMKKRKKRKKIVCPFCNKKVWTLAQFYAHLKFCEKRKDWKFKRPCWETKLQGGGKEK